MPQTERDRAEQRRDGGTEGYESAARWTVSKKGGKRAESGTGRKWVWDQGLKPEVEGNQQKKPLACVSLPKIGEIL